MADALSRMWPKCMAISSVTPLWVEDLITSYRNDHVTKALQEKLLLLKAETVTDYTLHAGIIRYK